MRLVRKKYRQLRGFKKAHALVEEGRDLHPAKRCAREEVNI